MATTEAWTIGRLLEWTTDYLRKQGSESPRLDAEVLLAHARTCPRIELYTSFHVEPSEPERTMFREMVRKRAEGMPVAYLVGHKEFFSLDFEVTPECLIPRPETEHLVVAALDWAKERQRTKAGSALTIVDVCTGSGCVAICLAKHLPAATIFACDLDQAALAVAQRNLSRHGLTDRVRVLAGDLLMALPQDFAEIDLIVSNPPYVSASEYSSLAPEVRNFEPKQALISDDEGLAASKSLIEQAESRLVGDGAMMLESSPMAIPRLEAWIQSRATWKLRPTMKDLSGRPRIVSMERSA